jgi:hypothetical protein
MTGGHPTSRPCRALIAATLMSIAACAGNGDGLDANGRPLAPGEGPTVPLSADFASIQANIFTPICSVCHIGGGAPEGLRLDAANSYNLLVGVASTEVPTLMRVAPGDPDNSYIIQKLEGHAAVGAQMPLGGPFLSTDTIAFIRQWITNGAPPSAISPAGIAQSLAVTSMIPDSTEPVAESPPQIMIGFNHDLNAAQVERLSASIERFEPQAPLTIIAVIPARVAVSQANLKAIMLWPATPLSAGHYRVVIQPSMGITDVYGQSISMGVVQAGGTITTFVVETLP